MRTYSVGEQVVKRIEWIDAAKGMLIVLVVLGHCHVNDACDMVICSFHMGAFFLLSGLNFHAEEPFLKFLLKKAKSLLFPYLIFALIMLCYICVGTFYYADRKFNLASGLISIFLPISGKETTSVYGLWFLPCLFLGELVLYGILRAWKKNRFLGFASAAGIGLVCGAVDLLTDCVSVINILPFAVTFLAVGYGAKDKLMKVQRIDIALGCLILFMVFTALNWYTTRQPVDLSSMNLGSWPLYVLSSLFGAVFLCSVSEIIAKIPVFMVLGRDTLYCYGLHYEVLGIVRKLVPGGGTAHSSHFSIIGSTCLVV